MISWEITLILWHFCPVCREAVINISLRRTSYSIRTVCLQRKILDRISHGLYFWTTSELFLLQRYFGTSLIHEFLTFLPCNIIFKYVSVVNYLHNRTFSSMSKISYRFVNIIACGTKRFHVWFSYFHILKLLWYNTSFTEISSIAVLP